MIINFWSMFLTIVGLCMFEVISSLDNAIINAEILKTIKSQVARRFFLTTGFFFAVFAVRGVMPFMIYYIPNYHLGLSKALSAFWSGDPAVKAAVASSEPMLVIGGGMFLVLLFLQWFLADAEKACSCRLEQLANDFGGSWFFAVGGTVALVAAVCIQLMVPNDTQALRLTMSVLVGLSAFLIADGFKQWAAGKEKQLKEESDSSAGDWAKVVFLEIIDGTFSLDGVVGAFAFTANVLLILLGNGLGAFVVRKLTLSNTERLCRYPFLKNGAMYNIGILGLIMIAKAFGVSAPGWVSPAITFVSIGGFLWLSIIANRKATGTVVETLEEVVK